MPTPSPQRSPLLRRALVVAILLAVTASAVVWADAAGAGGAWQEMLDRVDRFLAGPLPDRSVDHLAIVTPEPTARPTATPPVVPSSVPPATPAPTAERVAVDVQVDRDPAGHFAHEIRNTWCSPAGVEITLAILGVARASDELQREIAGRIHEWESWTDSHNGGWGPSAMVQALAAYGAPGYQVRAYETRAAALGAAAVAIATTEEPAVLLAWRGAHTWVMTGYRADADPRLFPDATIAGAYIQDPWFPTVSSIWGASDPPGTFQDGAEMIRNFLPWKRPEGRYPGRDGRFIVLIPTHRQATGP
ncbi:MAG: hypothetical protein HY264_02345 [Chloroflexi bacterium]|nr:hypothetical protein [Chloroflexota bacterium]